MSDAKPERKELVTNSADRGTHVLRKVLRSRRAFCKDFDWAFRRLDQDNARYLLLDAPTTWATRCCRLPSASYSSLRNSQGRGVYIPTVLRDPPLPRIYFHAPFHGTYTILVWLYAYPAPAPFFVRVIPLFFAPAHDTTTMYAFRHLVCFPLLLGMHPTA